jgi:DNA-binding MarR family transcriptional regulator
MPDNKNDTVAAYISSMAQVFLAFKLFIRNKLKENNIDLTFEMQQVLIVLSKKEGINQQELANLLQKDKASMTFLIDNLSKRRLVQRTEDPDDRRNKIITLTTDGTRLCQVLLPWIEELYTMAGKNISTQLFKDSVALSQKVKANIMHKQE